MRAIVEVMLNSKVLDPQGKAVEGALSNMGLSAVKGVRIGKRIELEIAEGLSQEEAQAQVEEAADKLLANPVIETWSISWER
ncbi:MAG: phosphoribosylformylglycinamidine synthase subunit PurS [Myxococcota bacterium]|jgi:phosphoribosylformylglycinamidine synthase PurS subunit|nr:phosphoribosylformylglycinamidine synthase subunit PurS [Myxococcota bacterium]